MNPIAEEIYGIIEESEEDIQHYGIKRRSGRYPYGSGENPYQHGGDFISRIDALKKDGWTETPENIKEAFGMTTTQYRTQKSIAKDNRRIYDVTRAKSLAQDGKGATEIANILSEQDGGRKINESTVRSWLNADSETKMLKARNAADFLKKQIDEKGMIDVGKNVNLYPELNISKEKMDVALELLKNEGYEVWGGRVPQPTNPNQMTTIKVACPPGTPHKEIYNYDKVHSIEDYISRDGGETFEKKFTYPASMDSKRLQIKYNEQGGVDMDGIVELRRGVDDLSLGGSRYAQVRILVDGTHYIKGMAIYSDDLPKGVDVRFNTNKKVGTPMKDVLKEIKSDPDNPFGSAIKDAKQGGQYWYEDKKTGEKKLGLINKRADEGDWTEWKDKLPSQFLSKQSDALARKQLGIALKDKQDEFDKINSLTNPTLKKNLLETFANDCDSAAVHLQAAAIPGQKYHVIVPANTLKDTEIYAPGYENGTQLALIRYPHGGQFEIPILTVNNRNKQGQSFIGKQSVDAVCINKTNADRLSGADFDGDTVMCIPTGGNTGINIKNRPALEGLKGFEPKDEYGGSVKVDDSGTKHYYNKYGLEYPLMTKRNTQIEMGKVSNLITDMTLRGAKEDDLAKAVRHSMVVIDANKHHLDYKRSEVENDIKTLKQKYQDGGGASTLISKAGKEVDVDKRQGSPRINQKGKDWYDPSKPEGTLIYKTAQGSKLNYDTAKLYKRGEPNGEIKVAKSGKRYFKPDNSDDWIEVHGKNELPEGTRVHGKINTNTRTEKSTYMAETTDARTLISPSHTTKEVIYADYANNMKALANKARMTMFNTGKIAYDTTAAKTYASEVKSLDDKLKNAQINAPRERRAIMLTNAKIKALKDDNPDMTKEDIKKASQRALSKYREEVGSVSRTDRNIKITDREWEAIQAGAIHESKLKQILNNTDKDSLMERAMPREKKSPTSSQKARIKALAATDKYTLQQIADKLGYSKSTIDKILKGEE